MTSLSASLILTMGSNLGLVKAEVWGGRGRAGWPGEGVPGGRSVGQGVGRSGRVGRRRVKGREGPRVKAVGCRSVVDLYLPSGEQPASRSLEGSCLNIGLDSNAGTFQTILKLSDTKLFWLFRI